MYRNREGELVNKSPWEIGASHWNQRDLYTQNARLDDGGYGLGPSSHPEEGSYAYPRGEGARERRDDDPAHVAWPVLRLHPTDEDVHREVMRALAVRSGVDASGVTADVHAGIVTLTGEVPTRAQRHRAEELTRACAGVHDVHNKLRVKSDRTPFDPIGLVMPLRPV